LQLFYAIAAPFLYTSVVVDDIMPFLYGIPRTAPQPNDPTNRKLELLRFVEQMAVVFPLPLDETVEKDAWRDLPPFPLPLQARYSAFFQLGSKYNGIRSLCPNLRALRMKPHYDNLPAYFQYSRTDEDDDGSAGLVEYIGKLRCVFDPTYSCVVAMTTGVGGIRGGLFDAYTRPLYPRLPGNSAEPHVVHIDTADIDRTRSFLQIRRKNVICFKLRGSGPKLFADLSAWFARAVREWTFYIDAHAKERDRHTDGTSVAIYGALDSLPREPWIDHKYRMMVDFELSLLYPEWREVFQWKGRDEVFTCPACGLTCGGSEV
jgi:hypothetical protein